MTTELPAPIDATREQINAAVTEWREQREKRLAAEKVAAKLKEREDQLKEFLIAAMLEQKYEGTTVGGRNTGLRTTEVPICEDRAAFDQYVLDNRDLSLLQFRLATTAINERIEAGITLPGIAFIDKYDLYDRKA